MGWETRGPNGRTYYYRKTRTSDGRVKSTYLGAGPLACLSAEADAMCRALVAYRDASLKRFEEAVDASAAATCALTAEVKAAQAQALEEQGLHYHRGEWRRPRVQPPAGPSAPPLSPIPQRGNAGSSSRRPFPLPPALAPPAPSRPSQGSGVEKEDTPPEEYRPAPSPAPTKEHALLDSWSDVIQRTLNDAHTLRAEVERSLGAGEGDEDHPTLKRLRGVVGVLGAAWGYATPFPTPDRSDAVSGNDSEPHALTAARAVSAVLEQADDRGRLALLARVDAVRQEYGWSEASPLAQRVIDQYALAVVHDETVRVCCKALDKGNSVTTSTTVLLKEVIATLAEAGGAAPQQPLDDAGAAGGRAWARRRASAERGLRRATRLLRHAQKAGWLPPENPGDAHHQEVGENGQQSHPARSLADPFAPLAAPKPALRRPPLRGRAAEAAAETRAYIDALRAAWPPPTRIREEELLAPDCLWSPFDYVVECDDAGCLIGEGTWLVRVRMPASPDELLAALAEWAPEYAD